MKLLGTYKNGNYTVQIYNDGTKIRTNDLDNLNPSFAESTDITITKECDGGCPFCYAECHKDAGHPDLFRFSFITSLHPFTEVALNGNDLTHPQLETFLLYLRQKNVLPNITVNQKHFVKNYEKLKDLAKDKLFFGLGISYDPESSEEDFWDFIRLAKEFKNAVIHTIAGILEKKDIDRLSDNDLKLLILGYKQTGRGVEFYKNNTDLIDGRIDWLQKNLKEMTKHFKVISFDNLALDQLDVKNTLGIPDSEWKNLYNGDEGSCTFYIDMVKGTFARSSLEHLGFKITPEFDTVDKMFNFIRRYYDVGPIR